MRLTKKLFLATGLSALLMVGCAPIGTLEYLVDASPVLDSSGGDYHIDPIDSSVVWTQEGISVKVKFYNDQMLDAEYDPKTSPYTLTPWIDPERGYTPPLWTVFDITVINQTRDRVELDPTNAILVLENGQRFFCRQGAGHWYDETEYYDYSYVKWGGRDGVTHYHANFDRNDVWTKSEYRREKPVRKGRKYNGKLTFPALPPDTKSFTLHIDKFILAFDKFEVGWGNPVEFTDMAFRFGVNQGVREKVE